MTIATVAKGLMTIHLRLIGILMRATLIDSGAAASIKTADTVPKAMSRESVGRFEIPSKAADPNIWQYVRPTRTKYGMEAQLSGKWKLITGLAIANAEKPITNAAKAFAACFRSSLVIRVSLDIRH